MGTLVIIAILVVIAAFAVRSAIRHMKGEGGCCGGCCTCGKKKKGHMPGEE